MSTGVSLSLAGDFADIFEVRGGPRREARGHALAPKRLGRGVVLAYVGEDEVFREAVIELDPQPDADRAGRRARTGALGDDARARSAGDGADDG